MKQAEECRSEAQQKNGGGVDCAVYITINKVNN